MMMMKCTRSIILFNKWRRWRKKLLMKSARVSSPSKRGRSARLMTMCPTFSVPSMLPKDIDRRILDAAAHLRLGMNLKRRVTEKYTNRNFWSVGGGKSAHNSISAMETALSPSHIDTASARRVDINAELHKAILKGQTTVAVELIARGADVNAKDRTSVNTPLCEAIWRGHMEIATALIALGAADLNAKDQTGRTPLHMAIWGGKTKVATELIARGADLNAKDQIGRTPLHAAIFCENMEIATALIDRGADLNTKDQGGRTPLHAAIFCENMEIATALIDRGADLNTKDQTGRTPLYVAVCGGRTEIASLLIDRGANVTERIAYLAGGHSEMAYFISRCARAKVADATSLLTVRSSGDADLGGQEQECKRSRIKL